MSSHWEEFAEKFRIQELELFRQGRWLVSLRPGQLTLGSMVVSDTRGAESFAELELEGGRDWLAAVARFERLVKGHFGADKVNVIALMMVDPVVHFHLLPRYSSAVNRYERDWSDPWWPKPPTFGGPDTETELLLRIRDDVRALVEEAG